jgi:L-glutamine---4-(methylsulfanyl)-2-oxobutanoate aminotransferase
VRPRPNRLERLPEQYFSALLRRVAAAAAAEGEPVVDLGRGNPEVGPPQHVVDALAEAANRATAHGYSALRGSQRLREAIAERYRTVYGVELDPVREVAVVPGTKTGIMLACVAAAGRGDTILLPDPGYPDYPSGVALAGATPGALPLEATAGWQPDFDAVAGERPAAVWLNYPSNPCAVCEHPGTFERAVAWCRERESWLVHDLAYGFLAFDGRRARSVLEIDGARDCALELWSPSKIYGMAGWRVGFAVGNAELVGRIQTLLDHTAAGVFTALQRGLAAALRSDQTDVAQRREIYRARRDRLVDTLRAAGAEIDLPEGSFYAWWRLPDGLTPERLIAEARVGVAPGEGFGARGAGSARLSLATPDADIAEAGERLAAIAGTAAR